jgi:hypothetical protein
MKSTRYYCLLSMFVAVSQCSAAQPAAPENVIRAIVSALPGCAIHSLSAGPLFRKNGKDVAATLICEARAAEKDKGSSGPYAIAILRDRSQGDYEVAYATGGLLVMFRTEIKQRRLILHSGVPGTRGGKAAMSYDYSFRLDGGDLVLTDMTVESLYIGEGEPTEDFEYRIFVEFLTGMVIDSRNGSGAKKLRQPQRITLKQFPFEPFGY